MAAAAARARRRALAGSPEYPWIVLAVALFGLFSVGFTITILSVSIPRIADELGTDASTVTWVVTGPLLAFAVRRSGDGQARRPPRPPARSTAGRWRACACSPALTAAAWSAGALIAFRMLGAATGAASGPASIAIINRLFPRERRVQAMGYWSMVGAGGPVVGVVAGGPIVETFGWRWIFVAQVPLTLAGLLLALLVLPETDAARAASPFDCRARSCSAVGATSLLVRHQPRAAVGLVEPGDRRRASCSRPLAVVAFVVDRAAGRAPAAAAGLPAPPQLHVRHRHPVLHQLRLHGRLRHHAAASSSRCSATRRRASAG